MLTRYYKDFEVEGKKITFECWSGRHPQGFYHACEMIIDNREVAKAKTLYYNRTWEAWRFQSVIRKAASKADIDEATKEALFQQIKD